MSRVQRAIVCAFAALVVAVKVVRWRGKQSRQRIVQAASAGEPQPSSSSTRGPRALTLVLAGLVVSCAALIVGRPLLSTDLAPLVDTFGVQALGPAAGDGQLGLVVRVGVSTAGCDGTAETTIVVAGTQQYWNKVKRKPASRRFAVIVGDSHVRVRDVGIANAAVPLLDAGVFFAPYIDQPIQSYVVRRNARTTVITGSAKGWGDDGSALVVQLFTPWLARRDYSSCWLKLPALTGAMSQQEDKAGGLDPGGGGRRLKVALKPAESRALGSDEPLLATTYIQTLAGTVDSGASSPSPTSNGRSWSYPCRGRRLAPLGPAQLAERLRSGQSPKELADRLLAQGTDGLATKDGFSRDTYLKGVYDGKDCAATAVINDAGGGTRRDLFVLLLGAMFGLAGTLIVEGGLVALRLRGDAGLTSS